jgi:hypothetical protein
MDHIRSDQYSIDYQFYDGDDLISAVFEHLADHELEENTGVYEFHYVRIKRKENNLRSRIEDTTYPSENPFKFYKSIVNIWWHFYEHVDFKKVVMKPNPTNNTETRFKIYLRLFQKNIPNDLTCHREGDTIVLTKN